jgi:hypothetical protein
MLPLPMGLTTTCPCCWGNGDGTLGTAHLFAGGFANGAVVIDSGNARPGIAISEQVSFTRAEVVVIKNDTPQK